MDTRTRLCHMDGTLLQGLGLILAIMALCIQGVVTDDPNRSLPKPVQYAYQDIQKIMARVNLDGTMDFDEGINFMNDMKTITELLDPDERLPILNSTYQTLLSSKPRGYVSDIILAFLPQAMRYYKDDPYLSTLETDTIQNIKAEKMRSLPPPQPTPQKKWSNFFQNPIGAMIDHINSQMQPDPIKPYSNYNYKLDPVFSITETGNYSDDSDHRAPTAEGDFVNGIITLTQKPNSTQMEEGVSKIVGGASGMIMSLMNETKLGINLTVFKAYLEGVRDKRDEIASQFASIPDQPTKELLMNAIEEAVRNSTIIMKNLTTYTISDRDTINKVNAFLNAMNEAAVIGHDMVLFNGSLMDVIVRTLEKAKHVSFSLTNVFISNETVRNKIDEMLTVMLDTSASIVKKVMGSPQMDISGILVSALQGAENVTETLLEIWPLTDKQKQFLYNVTLIMNDAIKHLANETSDSET